MEQVFFLDSLAVVQGQGGQGQPGSGEPFSNLQQSESQVSEDLISTTSSATRVLGCPTRSWSIWWRRSSVTREVARPCSDPGRYFTLKLQGRAQQGVTEETLIAVGVAAKVDIINEVEVEWSRVGGAGHHLQGYGVSSPHWVVDDGKRVQLTALSPGFMRRCPSVAT